MSKKLLSRRGQLNTSQVNQFWGGGSVYLPDSRWSKW